MGAMVAAEAAGIPFRVFMPNIYLLPTKGIPPIGLGLRPAKGAPGRLRDRALTRFTGRMWDRNGTPGLNALRATRGLPPVLHFWDQLRAADRQIVMTSDAFDFPGELPDNVAYVGPVLDDPTWTEPWAPPAGDDPLVLVALSSTFQDQGDCLQRIVDALATLPVRVVVTTGPALDPTTIRSAANVSVVRSAPHTEVLRHAAVTVNHGGHGTVMKALTAGVPMLVLPHGRDQADNAVRVTSRGAGLALKRSAKPAAIAAAVRRLIAEPSFGREAQDLGARILADTARGELVVVLEDVPRPCVSA
jgi:MGT family glycosyltransferase